MYNNPKYCPDLESRSAEEASRYAERMTEEFRVAMKHQVDVVGISEFRRVMLPMLAEIAHGREFDIERWFTMVSHPSVELSVVSDETGEELYRLSSVWQQTDISCKDDELEGMSIYVESLNMLKSTDMIAAHDRLMELADERIDHTSPDKTIADAVLTIERLNKVFADHNLPTLPDPNQLLVNYERIKSGAAPADPVAVAPTVEEDVELEYDEL